MAQQTAVEWLGSQLNEKLRDIIAKGDYTSMKELFVQAKQIEREQIIRTWENGNLPTTLGRVLTAEQYYNETYGNNQNK